MKPKEAIALLQQCDPEEELLITWWGDVDWEAYKDKDQAYSLAEEQLDTCIGHINEWVQSQYEEGE
mgnify:FL=1